MTLPRSESDGPAAAETVTIDHVDAELSRRMLFRLSFSRDLELRYEADTKDQRALHIRLTVFIGLLSYIAFCFVDFTLLPDLGWLPTLARLLLITPAGLFAMWMCTRVNGVIREAFIALAISVTLVLPVCFMAASDAPLAPYSMLVVLLVSMFGNITMLIRFHWSCFFSAVTVVSVGMMLLYHPGLPAGLPAVLMIATMICVSFGMIANHQLERSERRTYLMALRETLRADQLSADKDIYSALSLSDPLTGLPNRRVFDAAFDTCLRRHRDNGTPFSLIMVDVDFFKQYNDHYGHPAGDACLVRIGTILAMGLASQSDVVARYGGEEFAVLLSDCDPEAAARFARNLCARVNNVCLPHANREDGHPFVTISAGVASSAAGSDGVSMMADADRALYTAKRRGRNQAVAAGYDEAFAMTAAFAVGMQ